MSVLEMVTKETKKNLLYTQEVLEAFNSSDRAESFNRLVQKRNAEATVSFDQSVIDGMIINIKDSIENAIKDVEPKEAEAIKRVATQLIEYLIACKKNNVEPIMVMKVFDNISEDTIRNMFIDSQFDIVDYLNNPDKYVKPAVQVLDENLESVQDQAESVVEDIKAALDPVSPIVQELDNGKVVLDMNKVISTGETVSDNSLGKSEEVKSVAPAAQNPVRPVDKPEKKKDKNKKSDSSKSDHQCTDPNCTCHGDGINWPANIAAYFDTSSLFSIKNKEMKKLVGERIARAFDNLDTLQELTNYAGDAPETPFNFKLTGVSGKNNFVLTTDRTINGKYTKLTFTFFENGATITAA